MKACESTKPRLAEILGVEVGERFHIGGSKDKTFWVTDDGYFETDPPHFAGASFMLIDAINHPEKIFCRSRLTEAEIAICKAVGAKWVSCNECDNAAYVELWRRKPAKMPSGMFFSAWPESRGEHIASVRVGLFPSVVRGACICAEEADE